MTQIQQNTIQPFKNVKEKILRAKKSNYAARIPLTVKVL